MKIPTIIAILILIIGLGGGIFAMTQIQNLKSSANGTGGPQNVKILNIKDTSFAVSWLTDTPTIGFVEYASTQSAPTPMETAHFVALQNLEPDTSYSVKVNPGGSTIKVQTLPGGSGETSQIISGKAFTVNNLPAKNALVHVDLPTGASFGTEVAPSGNWIITIPALSDSTILQITVQASPKDVAAAKIDLKSANPTPDIILGNSYDFTNQSGKPNNSDIPSVPISLP